VHDYFKPPAVCLIEWPGRGKGFLPSADIHFFLADEGDGRRLSWQAGTVKGAKIAHNLNKLLVVQGSNDSQESVQ
jgi:tRNA threonylcarbamoyladenosine biosynthesis protein TsaE